MTNPFENKPLTEGYAIDLVPDTYYRVEADCRWQRTCMSCHSTMYKFDPSKDLECIICHAWTWKGRSV